MKKILAFAIVAALVGAIAAAQMPGPPPGMPGLPPLFKVTGMFQTNVDLFANDDTSAGTTTGMDLNPVVEDFDLSVDSNGTGINFGLTNFNPLQFNLVNASAARFDTHVTLFNGMLYVAAGAVQLKDYCLSTMLEPPGPLAGDYLGVIGGGSPAPFDQGVEVIGTALKIQPTKDLSVGVFVPMTTPYSSWTWSLPAAMATGNPWVQTVNGFANLNLSDAYGKSELAAKYDLEGIGTAYVGTSLYDNDMYVNFDYKGMQGLLAKAAVMYNWNAAGGATYDTVNKVAGTAYTQASADVGYKLGSFDLLTEDLVYFASDATRYGLNGSVKYDVAKDITLGMMASYGDYNVMPGFNAGWLADTTYDTAWSVFPNITFNNADYPGPVHSIQVGFRYGYDQTLGKYSWQIPLSVAILVL